MAGSGISCRRCRTSSYQRQVMHQLDSWCITWDLSNVILEFGQRLHSFRLSPFPPLFPVLVSTLQASRSTFRHGNGKTRQRLFQKMAGLFDDLADPKSKKYILKKYHVFSPICFQCNLSTFTYIWYDYDMYILCIYIYMHIVTEGRFIVKLQSCLDQGKVLGEKVVSPKIYHERVSRRFVQCVAWGCLQLKC